MLKLHQISAPELVKWLKKQGFERVPGGKSSHVKLRRGNRETTVSIKHGKKKLPIGTLKQILSDEQTGLEREYREYFS